MARVNISIPDDLYNRLEEIRRGDATLNVSAICQEALGREVARREPLPAEAEVSEEVLSRLRTEREEYEQTSRERGIKMGREWARRAKYQQLRYWGQYKLPSGRDLRDLKTPPCEYLDWLPEEGPLTSRREIDDVIKAHPEFQHAEVVSEYDPRLNIEFFWFQLGDRQLFNQGFLQAVKGFWEQVKERI